MEVHFEIILVAGTYLISAYQVAGSFSAHPGRTTSGNVDANPFRHSVINIELIPGPTAIGTHRAVASHGTLEIPRRARILGASRRLLSINKSEVSREYLCPLPDRYRLPSTPISRPLKVPKIPPCIHQSNSAGFVGSKTEDPDMNRVRPLRQSSLWSAGSLAMAYKRVSHVTRCFFAVAQVSPNAARIASPFSATGSGTCGFNTLRQALHNAIFPLPDIFVTRITILYPLYCPNSLASILSFLDPTHLTSRPKSFLVPEEVHLT
jgi:hypothetical protein